MGIPGQHGTALQGVVETEGIHAPQIAQTLDSVANHPGQQHLRISIAMETLTQFQESLAQLLMVVDLAVEDQPPSAAGRRHGLVTSRREVKYG